MASKNAKMKKFKTPTGVTLTLRPISQTLLTNIYDMEKPKPPMKPVAEVQPDVEAIPGLEVADEEDSEYVDALNRYALQMNNKIWGLIAVKGVVNTPPAEEIEELSAIFGTSDKYALKRMWVQSLFDDDAAASDFIDAAIGVSGITEEGLKSVNEAIREAGEQSASTDSSGEAAEQGKN